MSWEFSIQGKKAKGRDVTQNKLKGLNEWQEGNCKFSTLVGRGTRLSVYYSGGSSQQASDFCNLQISEPCSQHLFFLKS